MRLVFATRNLGKLKEIRELWSELPLEIAGLDEWPEFPEIVEDGETFAENSLIKAQATMEYTGLPSMADDSGLCVDALDGWPGVVSARVAETDHARCLKVLERLLPHPEPEARTASFVCVATLCLPGGTRAFSAEGRAAGRIEKDILPGGGFGYDPVFYSFDLGMRFSEATAHKKNRVSHRGRAFRQLAEEIAANGLI